MPAGAQGRLWLYGIARRQLANQRRGHLRRSQLVACSWFKRWSDARRSGDDAGVREAITAMRTAKDWPILQEMSRSGAYPAVPLEFVKAMPSGRWAGRPLAGDVDSGLGCPSYGVPLS